MAQAGVDDFVNVDKDYVGWGRSNWRGVGEQKNLLTQYCRCSEG